MLDLLHVLLERFRCNNNNKFGVEKLWFKLFNSFSLLFCIRKYSCMLVNQIWFYIEFKMVILIQVTKEFLNQTYVFI